MNDLAALPALVVLVVRRAGFVAPALGLLLAFVAIGLAFVAARVASLTDSVPVVFAVILVDLFLVLAAPMIFHAVAAAAFGHALTRPVPPREAVALALRSFVRLVFSSSQALGSIFVLGMGASILVAGTNNGSPYALLGAPIMLVAFWSHGRDVTLSTAVLLLEPRRSIKEHRARLKELTKGRFLLVLAAGAVPLGILLAVSITPLAPELGATLVPAALAAWIRVVVPLLALPFAALADAAIGAAMYGVVTGKAVSDAD